MVLWLRLAMTGGGVLGLDGRIAANVHHVEKGCKDGNRLSGERGSST